MSNVVAFARPLYRARAFAAQVGNIPDTFKASGTLCGHIDFAIPGYATFSLSPAEAVAISLALRASVSDVLENSDPERDPRLYDEGERP